MILGIGLGCGTNTGFAVLTFRAGVKTGQVGGNLRIRSVEESLNPHLTKTHGKYGV